MKKMSENPWDVADVNAFLLYSCPECNYQEVCQNTFIQHAVNNHERSRILFAANINTPFEEYNDSKLFNSNFVNHHNDHDYAMQINNIKMDEEEDLPLHNHNASEDVKPDIIFDIDIESEKKMQKNCTNNRDIPSQINDDNVIRIFKDEDFQTNSMEENVVQEDNMEYDIKKHKYKNMDYSPNQTLEEMKPVIDDNTKSPFKVHSDAPPATGEKLQFHICKYCSLIYKNKADYKKHLQEIHCEFQCETCVINNPEGSVDSCLIYNNQADYENHLQKVHTNSEKFKCGDCGFISTSNVELWSHKIKTGHSGDSTFQNKEGITKNKPGFLELRGSAPFGNKPTELVCQKCGFACESSDSIYNTIEFVTHLRMRHEMSTPYKCEKCDFICEEKPLIIDHMKSVHYYMPLSDNIVVVACQLCEFKIFSGINKKARLKLHLRKKHSQKKNQKYEKKYACSYCQKKLTSQLSLEKHVRIVHDVPLEEAMKNCKSEVTVKNIVNDWENKVQCPYCDLLLRNNTELGIHLPRHTKEFYTCDKFEKCNFKTLSKKKFQNHEKKFHIDTNDWKCDQCDFRISYENHNFVLHNSASKGSIIKKYQRTLNQHKFMKHSIHFSNTDNCCNICDQICGSQRDLRLHLLKTHNIGTIYKGNHQVPLEKATCHICNKVFTSKFHSLKHLKNEHGIVNNGVLCYKCGIVYTTADELKNHQNEKHGKLDYICKFCDLNLNDLNGYNDHLKDNHKDYSKNFKCKLCKESSIIWHGVITLQLHYAENHNLHRKICEDCGAAVNSLQDLNKHKKAKIKEHVCEKCGHPFNNENSLKRHKAKIHNEQLEGSIKCKHCEKAFFHKQEFVRHMEITHLRKPRYFCDIEQCNFKTHSLPNLKSHTKFVHDKVKNFSCNLCDQKFIDKRAVTKHLKTKHGVVR